MWERPDPLAFGPVEPAGPPVSPAVAAYQPPAPTGPPAQEPSTAPITAPPSWAGPDASSPVTPAPAPGPVPTPPVSGTPVTAYPVPTTPPVPAPPAPAAYYPPTGYPGYPYQPAPGYPAAYDPTTGVPYSDKSKVAAGLLQLLLGFFLAIGGIGRLYAGNTTIGVVQLVMTGVAWISLICGAFLILPWVITFGLWVWFWVDGIIMLAGRPVDGQGRLLRP